MNLLELLQQYQQAQKAPTMMGPVLPQNPQPGFRAPPPMGMAPPPAQQPMGMPDMSGIRAGLARLGHGYKPGMEPNRTAGDRDLNGYGGSPADPFGNPNAVPTIYNPGGGTGGGLLGFFRGLF